MPEGLRETSLTACSRVFQPVRCATGFKLYDWLAHGIFWMNYDHLASGVSLEKQITAWTVDC